MDRTTLVLLHGRAHEPSSMRALTQRLGVEDVDCVAPAAPGGSWYPGRLFWRRAANEPALSGAAATVHRTLDAVRESGVPPERTVLGGFSQGACIAVDALWRRPRKIAALAVLCGGLIGTDDELVPPPTGGLAGLPVLISGVEGDAWVPVERVRRSAALLEAAGARVELLVQPPAEHRVQDAEVTALRRLVRALDTASSRRP